MGFHIFNKNNEDHNGPTAFYCGRGSVLGNPYTHIKDRKTKARFIVGTREEAVEKYSHYFDTMYGSNTEFTKAVDEIYEAYRSGKDVYLGCYCYPLKCHCEIIADKLRSRLVKEKLSKLRKAGGAR